ncbi:MAG: hypothetical protein ACOVMN_12485 [Flexibacteraceae bacterium]
MKSTTEKLAAGNNTSSFSHKISTIGIIAFFILLGFYTSAFAQTEIAAITPKVVTEPAKTGFVPAVYSEVKPNNLENLIQENLAGAVSDETDHVIKLYFTVDANGKVTNISSHGVYSSKLQSSLAKLTTIMPVWQPATFNGEPIPSKVIVPVKFTSSITRIGE